MRSGFKTIKNGRPRWRQASFILDQSDCFDFICVPWFISLIFHVSILSSLQVKALQVCKKAVMEICEKHNCNPILVRLAWHDAGEYPLCLHSLNKFTPPAEDLLWRIYMFCLVARKAGDNLKHPPSSWPCCFLGKGGRGVYSFLVCLSRMYARRSTKVPICFACSWVALIFNRQSYGVLVETNDLYTNGHRMNLRIGLMQHTHVY